MPKQIMLAIHVLILKLPDTQVHKVTEKKFHQHDKILKGTKFIVKYLIIVYCILGYFGGDRIISKEM